MSATAIRSRPARDLARRGYRRELQTALDLGVDREHVAEVVLAFRGECPDRDVLRVALMQYVPYSAFSAGHDDPPYHHTGNRS